MTEVKIRRLGHQGDGIAEGPLFVPLTLPGEVVSGVVDGQTMREVKVITPSDHRVKAPCRHFRACGGCQVQHAADDFVADWKTLMVTSALAAHQLETEIRQIKTSSAQSRRRVTFSARRTKKGAMAGFHGRASDVIVEVPDCQLVDPALIRGLDLATKLAEVGTSRKAELAVTITTSLTGLDVSVVGGKPLDEELQVALGQLVQDPKIARLSWNNEVIATRTPPIQSMGSATVTPPPGAFLQATAQGETDLLMAVHETVRGAGKVIDLFAGCGTFSLPLAAQSEVHAVEGDAAMISALDGGWRMAKGLKPVTTEVRDLFRRPLLPDEFKKVDAVVLDPPRAGAEAQVAELVKAKPNVLSYVSCNPVTFARDAAVLVAGGYTLDWVQVVDQFRWSSHVELAAQFTACDRA